MSSNFTNEQEIYLNEWINAEQSLFYRTSIAHAVIAFVLIIISLFNLFRDWHNQTIWFWLVIGLYLVIALQSWQMSNNLTRDTVERVAREGDKYANIIIFSHILIVIFIISNVLVIKSLALLALLPIVIINGINHSWRVKKARQFRTLKHE